MFSFGKPRVELGVVFDIGSSSVGAALALFEKGIPSRVVYDVREPISLQEKPEPGRFFDDMLSALGRVNAIVLKDGLATLSAADRSSLSIRHVAYIFSSPWSVSQTKTVTINKYDAFTFTRAMVNEIIEDSEKIFAKSIREDGLSDLPGGLSIIEKRVIHIALNGYQVPEPYGKKTRRADMSFFMSFAPKAVIDRISEVSMSTFHPRDTKIFSAPLVAFSVIRDSFHNTDDFVFLDVGGEISEVSVIKGGLILETISFPTGFRSLVRSVAADFFVTYTEAESLINLDASGHGDDSVRERLVPAVDRAAQAWSDAFHKALSGLSTRMSMPRELFASADSDLVRFLVGAIKDERVSQFGVAEVPFFVTLLSPDKLKDLVVFAPTAQKDMSIALAVGFIGRSGLESY
ncbi:MAG: hypothetical protein WC763_04525 [Candidatus Paceibacterota bacterium]|jgi:hypothetical protein